MKSEMKTWKVHMPFLWNFSWLQCAFDFATGYSTKEQNTKWYWGKVLRRLGKIVKVKTNSGQNFGNCEVETGYRKWKKGNSHRLFEIGSKTKRVVFLNQIPSFLLTPFDMDFHSKISHNKHSYTILLFVVFIFLSVY